MKKKEMIEVLDSKIRENISSIQSQILDDEIVIEKSISTLIFKHLLENLSGEKSFSLKITKEKFASALEETVCDISSKLKGNLVTSIDSQKKIGLDIIREEIHKSRLNKSKK